MVEATSKFQNLLKIGMLVWGEADSETSPKRIKTTKIQARLPVKEQRRTSKTSSALEALWKTFFMFLFVHDRNICLRKERYALANGGSETLDRLDLSRCWNKLNPLLTNLSSARAEQGLNKYFLKESSDDETSTSGSDDEEYAMAVRNFKNFFRRQGKFVRKPREEKKSFRQRDEERKSDQKCVDAVIQIISLAIVQNHLATKIKRLSLEVLGAIAKMTPMTKLTTKLVSWINLQIRCAQGYNQQEGIDYDEIYAPVARLESIRILLAIACANDFKLYQMDIKSAFLNGFINEEVYVSQPLAQPSGFIDFEKPNYVYKLKYASYGLKQAPKAWYDRLKAYLLKHEYSMRMVDNTLFTKKFKSHLIIIQIYADDIIFGSTCQNLCDDFVKIMHDEFEMSMMGS
ncbi:retrovirus-related pol polyprotein from transposon TNT 1-94 [Tanacetum coccineum]